MCLTKQNLADALEGVRSLHPLVHCITNFVTVNDCANILLAIGASPTMADTPEEMAEIVALANALEINIGTLNASSIPAMFHAANAAHRLGRPALLDPVGVGASSIRTRTARELIETGAFSLIRGNASEIRALAGTAFTSRGVDASAGDAITRENLEATCAFVKEMSRKTKAVIAISGPDDFICDGIRAVLVHNGHPLMPLVTGSGCMLSSICGAFLAVSEPFTATVAAFVCMGICGEIAHERLLPDEGNAAYRTRMIDAMFHLTPQTVLARAQFEEVPLP